MKNTIIFFAFGLMLLSSCKNNETKIENAQENILDAKKELIKSQRDSLADYEEFKLRINEKITANELKIAELKVKAVDGNKSEKARTEERISKLTNKNNELKAKLDINYDSATWESFKIQVEKNADELEKEFDALKAEKND